MLNNSLFTIISADHQDNVINAVLELDVNNEIFNGHFPGQPVLPGACMFQMVKEVLQDITGVSCQLKKADNLKFLTVVDPREDNKLDLELKYSINDRQINVTGSLSARGTVFFKLQGSFTSL
jgi:3-hydroxyacyl-[acyl-carrier-protein] dehydratase